MFEGCIVCLDSRYHRRDMTKCSRRTLAFAQARCCGSTRLYKLHPSRGYSYRKSGRDATAPPPQMHTSGSALIRQPPLVARVAFRQSCGPLNRNQKHQLQLQQKCAHRQRRSEAVTCGVSIITCSAAAVDVAASAGMGEHPASAQVDEGLRNGFGDPSLDNFAIGVMGDLHLEPDAQFMRQFEAARGQMRRHIGAEGAEAAGARVVQLGDLGGYTSRPGSRECLTFAADFLAGFGVKVATVTGNHDLEGEDFETDEANLQAWQEILGQRHYWKAQLGPLLCIGLSTVRFRSNKYSVHEVHIDQEQLQWLEGVLAESGDTPVAMFTHAPPMGSGLQVVQEVHVKNRCAWLNHSSDPAVFIRLTERYPNIRMWFSGHFHLSHNYPDSISVVGRCAFVQTGVIGNCNRDGYRQSRLIKGNAEGFQVLTIDHEDDTTRVDLQHRWDDPTPPQPQLQEDELICSTESGGWLCSQLECDISSGGNNLTPRRNSAVWFAVGSSSAVALQAHMLVEYDIETRSPIGLLCLDVDEGEEEVVLLDADQRQLAPDGSDSRAGEDVASIVLQHSNGSSRSFERNPETGLWFRVLQQNKWQKKLREQATAAAAASAAAATAGV